MNRFLPNDKLPFQEFGQQFFHVQIQGDLHGQALQHGVVLDQLDIIDGQADQQVHHDDAHDDEECREHEEGQASVGHVRDHGVVAEADVVVEQVVVLELADHHDRGLDHGLVDVVEVLLLGQERVKAQGEGHQEEDANDAELEEGLEHVGEHDHVDAQEGELPHVGEQVEPRGRDGDGAHLPLPVHPEAGLAVAVRKVQHEQDGRDVASPFDQILDAKV